MEEHNILSPLVALILCYSSITKDVFSFSPPEHDPTQFLERLWGSAVGLSWVLSEGQVSKVRAKICSDAPQR